MRKPNLYLYEILAKKKMLCPNCGIQVYDILKSCPTCGVPTTATTTHSNNKYIDAQDYKRSRKDRYQNLKNRAEIYKPMWDKDDVIQFKSDHIAILRRKLGLQVEFIIAFEDLTKEGYELKAIDAATESSSFSDGVNSVYYFQKFNN